MFVVTLPTTALTIPIAIDVFWSLTHLAGAYGITVEGQNTWKTLIQNASQENSVTPSS